MGRMRPPAQTKNEIVAILQANQEQLKTLGVKKLGLFGSFVRNEPDNASDIDLLVEFEPGQKTFDNFIQLSFLLEDLLARPVEVVTPESLSPYLSPHILKEVEYIIRS